MLLHDFPQIEDAEGDLSNSKAQEFNLDLAVDVVAKVVMEAIDTSNKLGIYVASMEATTESHPRKQVRE